MMKLKILKQQLFVADEWKRRYDEKMVRQQDRLTLELRVLLVY